MPILAGLGALMNTLGRRSDGQRGYGGCHAWLRAHLFEAVLQRLLNPDQLGCLSTQLFGLVPSALQGICLEAIAGLNGFLDIEEVIVPLSAAVVVGSERAKRIPHVSICC